MCASMCSKSPTCYDHTQGDVCFLRLLIREVGCEIRSLCSSAPKSCFHRFLSSLLYMSPSVSPLQPPPPCVSRRQWPCYRSFHTTLSSCAHLCHSSCLSHRFSPSLSFCLPSSLSQGQLCVIKCSTVAPLVHQRLCHPDGQIKNWFLRLIPCAGWMLSPSSLPSLSFTLSLPVLPTSYWCFMSSPVASS